jgi:hypothetical protein
LLLARRLRNRGFSTQTLAPLFPEAGNRALTLPAAGSTTYAHHPNPSNQETTIVSAPSLVFHLKYHPRGLERMAVRRAFETTLGPLLTECEFIVAVSRAPNLCDRLSSTILPDNPSHNPSDILSDSGDN